MEISLNQTANKTGLFDLISETNTKDLETKLNNEKLILKNWGNKNKTVFKILKYNKEFLARDNDNAGKFRSVIFDNDNKLVCYAPPKSMSSEKFMDENKDSDPVYYQEFIEGTMINMFYDTKNECWEIATRTSVGGNVYFFNHESNKKTFYDMFTEVCDAIDFTNYENMNKEYCYSFVMKHPDNRIVGHVEHKEIYLIDIYKCNTTNEKEYNVSYIPSVNIDLKSIGLPETIKRPTIYMEDAFNSENLSKANEYYASHNTPYYIMGIVIKNKNGARCKFRNPNYEMVRKLRGNQPKLQYQYLVLRKSNKVTEYLKYYKEDNKKFQLYRDQLHIFTNGLFQNYISCYIKKQKPLNEFPDHFKTHMYRLHHNIYMTELKPINKYINFEVVKNYVNEMHPSQQMYSMNYSKYNNKNVYRFDKNESVTESVVESENNEQKTDTADCVIETSVDL